MAARRQVSHTLSDKLRIVMAFEPFALTIVDLDPPPIRVDVVVTPRGSFSSADGWTRLVIDGHEARLWHGGGEHRLDAHKMRADRIEGMRELAMKYRQLLTLDPLPNLDPMGFTSRASEAERRVQWGDKADRLVEAANRLEATPLEPHENATLLLRRCLELRHDLPEGFGYLEVYADHLFQTGSVDIALAALCDELFETFSVENPLTDLEPPYQSLDVYFVLPDEAVLDDFREALRRREDSSLMRFVQSVAGERTVSQSGDGVPGTTQDVTHATFRILGSIQDNLLAIKYDSARTDRRRISAENFLKDSIRAWNVLVADTRNDLLAGELTYRAMLAGELDDAYARQAGNSFSVAWERENRRNPALDLPYLKEFKDLRNIADHPDRTTFRAIHLEQMRSYLLGLGTSEPGIMAHLADAERDKRPR
jgi:hypothetical protein